MNISMRRWRQNRLAFLVMLLVAGFIFLAQPAAAMDSSSDDSDVSVTETDTSSDTPSADPTDPASTDSPSTVLSPQPVDPGTPPAGGGTSSEPQSPSTGSAPPSTGGLTNPGATSGAVIQSPTGPNRPPVLSQSPTAPQQPALQQPIASPAEAQPETLLTVEEQTVQGSSQDPVVAPSPTATPSRGPPASSKSKPSSSAAAVAPATVKPGAKKASLASNITQSGSSPAVQATAIVILVILGLLYFRIMRRGGKRPASGQPKGLV